MIAPESLAQLATGVVLGAEPDPDVVLITGADRVRFLHGVLSGDVAGVPVGGMSHTALLSTKGHVLADARLVVRADDIVALLPAGQGAAFAEAVGRYAIMDDVAFNATPGLRCLAVLGPGAAQALDAACGEPAASALTTPWTHASACGVTVAKVRALGTDGFFLIAAAARVATALAAFTREGVARLAADVAEAARVQAGEPAWAHEITPERFPMECRLDDAVDFKKGCFLGQETIVRIRDRGHVNWRLVRLAVEGDARAGDAVESAARHGAKSGTVTSVGTTSAGTTWALGIVHTGLTVGAAVTVRGHTGAHPATVETEFLSPLP